MAVFRFQPGRRVTIGSSHDVAKPSRYQVKAVEEVNLISSRPGPHMARRVQGTSGDMTMDVLIAQEFSIPVEINWPDGGTGRVLEILEPQGSAAPAAEVEGNLGYCSELLQ